MKVKDCKALVTFLDGSQATVERKGEIQQNYMSSAKEWYATDGRAKLFWELDRQTSRFFDAGDYFRRIEDIRNVCVTETEREEIPPPQINQPMRPMA